MVALICGAYAPDWTTLCTLEPNHRYDHRAMGRDNVPITRWSQCPEALETQFDYCDDENYYGYRCTRTAGHQGMHAAANETEVIETWTN